MYAQSIVERRLVLAREQVGFMPEYHSVAEVDEFAEHLKKSEAFDKNGKKHFTRDYVDWEVRWMENEHALVMCDAAYALTRYCYLSDEENNIRRFEFRIPQMMIFSIISELEEKGASIELMLLKARQLGASTLVELLIGILAEFREGVNAIIASADREKSAKMAKMLFLSYDRLPDWLKPTRTRFVEAVPGMIEFGNMDSAVSVQHGAQMSGIARGTTPTRFHLSEVASFKDPVNQIEAAIWRAVHPSPNVFGVLESTAEGETGWWADRWRYTKSRWADGQARLCPLFLPWFCGIDIYPKPAFFATHPIPALWQPNKDTQEHVARAEMYVRSNTLIRRYLCAQRSGPRGGWWTDGHMPIEQQWFWEIGHEEAKENGSEPTWFQEMAGDDVEAFQKSYDSVFGHKLIAEVDSRREQNYVVYGIVGESVDECHEPDESEVDYSRERIALNHMSPRGERFRWELVPVKYGRGWTWEDDPENPTFNEAGHLRVTDREGRTIWLDPEAKLFVFEPPQPGVDYGLGGDCGAGTGHDFTSFTITKKGVRGEPDVEAAQWRSNRIGHVTSFAWGMPVALYYARAMKGARYEQPLAAIEQLASVGDTCQLQMKKMGYSRFFRFHRYDSHKVSPKNSTKDGWYTTGWSRPMLVDGFIEDVKKGWYKINSPWTANECRHFEVHLTKRGVKREHSDDSHDDGIFSAAISTFVLHDMEAKTDRAKKRTQPEESNSGLTVDIGPYQGHVVSTRKQRIVTLNDLRYNAEELERHRY